MALSQFEKDLFQQVRRLGLLIYCRMIVERDLFGFSEDIINQSYIKNLFSLPPDSEIPINEFPQWSDKIKQILIESNLWPIDKVSIEKQISEFKFKIDDQQIKFKDFDQINQRLASADSKLRICAGYMGATKSCILGSARTEDIGPFHIIYYTQELARTPNNPLTVAALTLGRDVFIREEAVAFIFKQKWERLFKPDAQAYPSTAEEIFYSFADHFKMKALAKFGINDLSSLRKKREQLFKYIYKNLALHEIGHHQKEKLCLDEEYEAIADASSLFGHNYLTNAIEWLSDFNPSEKLTNSISNILIEQREEALKYFYLLICDNYFYDTEDKLLSFITDLTILLLMDCSSEGEIKLEALKQKLYALCEDLTKRFKVLIEGIKKLLSKSKYIVAGKELDFNNLYLFTLNQVKEKNPEAKTIMSTVWVNIFSYIKLYNPVLFLDIKEILRNAERDFIVDKLNLLNIVIPAEKPAISEIRRKLLEYCSNRFDMSSL